MPLTLTTEEKRSVCNDIAPRFQQFLDEFDTTKYPNEAYDSFSLAFGAPAQVTGVHIFDALRWKYGHWNKNNFPQTHKNLINRVSSLWPEITIHQPFTASNLFTSFSCRFHISYITSAFLTHLLFPFSTPIIDQHNFRAMNHFVGQVRPGWTHKAKPSRYSDLEDIQAFMSAILATWTEATNTLSPSSRDLDKFLMAFGKSIAPHR
jgi:hypothetical protein